MANIQSHVDTLSLRAANNSQRAILLEFYKAFIEPEFKDRYTEIEKRLSSAEDLDTLQKLDSAQKFYRNIATYTDQLLQHIDFLTRSFDHIDEVYWDAARNHQRLVDENKALKAEIEGLRIREALIVRAWKSRENKRRMTLKDLLSRAA